MIGLSSRSKEAIAKAVEDLFDKIALQLIGDIPGLRHKRSLIVSTDKNYGLSNLFVQAMANKKPNEIEQDVLKGMLQSAHGYIESLKNRTKSNISERIDALYREAKIKRQPVNSGDIQTVLDDEMAKAKSHVITITEAEATKLRNMGTMMDISRVSANLGDSDPNIFFVIVRDGDTCNECMRLHMMPDKVTPKVWKFSELKQGYHKRGEEQPSVAGEHPNCRCALTYLSRGYGFKGGYVAFISLEHDEYTKQRGL